MEMRETLDRLKNVLDKDIGEVVAKGTMSPAELERVTKALCAVEQIKRLNSMDEMEREMSRGMYYDPRHEYMSGMRGRDQQTGRYMSRGMDGYDRMSGMDYQSGTDRRMYDRSGYGKTHEMLDMLERMKTDAKSESERRIVDEWINRIENGGR